MPSTQHNFVKDWNEYVPIDYLKGQIVDFDNQHLLSNCNQLKFTELVDTSSGEIIPRMSREGVELSAQRVATYKNLRFTHYTNSNRMVLSGSLHSFYNEGKHNFNDYDRLSFLKTLNSLENEFGIKPRNIKPTQLEWGVNLSPPIKTNDIISGLKYHGSNRFESKIDSRKGRFKQVEKDEYCIKIYNKSRQFGLRGELIRIERKQKNYRKYCLKNNLDQRLDSLIINDFRGMRSSLINNWNEILFFDPTTKAKNHDVIKYRDVDYWAELFNKSRTTKANHLKKLRVNNELHGENIQAQIEQLISSKLNRLSNA